MALEAVPPSRTSIPGNLCSMVALRDAVRRCLHPLVCSCVCRWATYACQLPPYASRHHRRRIPSLKSGRRLPLIGGLTYFMTRFAFQVIKSLRNSGHHCYQLRHHADRIPLNAAFSRSFPGLLPMSGL